MGTFKKWLRSIKNRFTRREITNIDEIKVNSLRDELSGCLRKYRTKHNEFFREVSKKFNDISVSQKFNKHINWFELKRDMIIYDSDLEVGIGFHGSMKEFTEFEKTSIENIAFEELKQQMHSEFSNHNPIIDVLDLPAYYIKNRRVVDPSANSLDRAEEYYKEIQKHSDSIISEMKKEFKKSQSQHEKILTKFESEYQKIIDKYYKMMESYRKKLDKDNLKYEHEFGKKFSDYNSDYKRKEGEIYDLIMEKAQEKEDFINKATKNINGISSRIRQLYIELQSMIHKILHNISLLKYLYFNVPHKPPFPKKDDPLILEFIDKLDRLMEDIKNSPNYLPSSMPVIEGEPVIEEINRDNKPPDDTKLFNSEIDIPANPVIQSIPVILNTNDEGESSVNEEPDIVEGQPDIVEEEKLGGRRRRKTTLRKHKKSKNEGKYKRNRRNSKKAKK